MIRAAFFGNNPAAIERVYAMGRYAQVAAATDLYPSVVSHADFAAQAANLADVRVAFGTWGFPELTSEELDRLPNLEAVFYGAGSVQRFARPFLERGITVVSAWAANAVPVAEFTLAQILWPPRATLPTRCSPSPPKAGAAASAAPATMARRWPSWAWG